MSRRLLLVPICAAAALSCRPAPLPDPNFGGLEHGRRTLDLRNDVQLLELTNGMKVAMIADDRTNLVSVDVRYRVGAAQDPAGHAGLAHLLEHLTFQVAADSQGGSIFDKLQAIAIEFNAYTVHDVTHYTATALANRVDALLEMEARRLETPCAKVPAAAFDRERDIVLEEEAERTTAWTPVLAEINRAVWGPGHPYARAIGSREVATATQADACAFFEQHYTPANAILVVVGNITPATLKPRIGRRFGTIARATASAPTAAPPRPAPAVFTGTASEHVADIAHPTALIYLPAPPWGDAKAAMHDMLVRAVASALDDLDEREPWITGTDIGYTGGGYQRATIVEVAVDDAARLDDAVAAVLRAGRAIFAEDDDDARQRWLSVMRGAQQTDAVTASDRFAGKADLVASYLTYTTDLRFWFAHMHATDAVTVPELRRYAAELFDPRAVHVATVRPSGREGVGGGAARVAISDHEYDLPPWRASVDPDGADRPEPVPPPPPPLRLYQDRLANGLHLIMYVAPRSPTFEARLVFPRGRIDEAPTERGVATLAATLLDHNHERRYAMPIYETLVWALTTVGTQVRVAVDEETTTFATRGLTMFGDWHLWRLAWLLDQGVYADSALARFRDMLRAHQERAASPSGRAFAERLYGVGHPYATPAASNAELARVGRRELNRWRRQTFVPDGATLIISGGFDPDEMLDNVRALFDGFPRRSVPARAPVAAPRPAAGPSWIGTRIPTDTQVTLYVSVTAASDRDRDRWARQILAEMVRDRLRVVRESMGASYGVQSSYHVGAAGSTFDITAALDPDRAPRAATAVRAALTALRDDPATMAADFVRARRRLVSQALATSTDPGDGADRIAWAVEHGGDLTQLNRVASDLAEVTLDQVAAVARADLDPARMVISVDGRAAPVQATLDALAATDVAWFDE
jgi:zinc protease